MAASVPPCRGGGATARARGRRLTPELFRFVNDLERPVGAYLYGRGMYETMVCWETAAVADRPPFLRDFAQLWQAADKIVYSKSLEAVSSARTRIERAFDPGTIRDIKAARDHDITVGGPNLAAQALKAGLVDECQLFLTRVVVGSRPGPRGGTRRAEPARMSVSAMVVA